MKTAIITDLHIGPDIYSNKGVLYKSGSQGLRLAQDFVHAANSKNVDLAIDLGDRITWESPSRDVTNMKIVRRIFNGLNAPLRYIPGNNEYKHLSAARIEKLSGQPTGSHILDTKDIRFIFWNPDVKTTHGLKLSSKELAHLSDLVSKDALKPTILCSHIPLDNNSAARKKLLNERPALAARDRYAHYYYTNAHEARKILEEQGNVILAMAGHRHKTRFNNINGITYFTLDSITGVARGFKAPGETHAYLDIRPDDNELRIDIAGKFPQSYRFTF